MGYLHRMKRERLLDFEKSFMEALKKAMELSPGLVIFGGDIFHQPRPDPRSMRLLVKSLLDMAEETRIILCVGNHEIEGNIGTAYIPLFSELHPNIHVLSTENPFKLIELGGKTVGVHGFQYIRSRDLAEKTLRSVSETAREKADYNILCIHQAVEGYLPHHELSIAALNEVASRYDLILTGHVHSHMRITELGVPAYYIGSTEHASFNEADNKTGFMVFKDFDYVNPQYVEVSSSPMKKIKMDLGSKTPEELNDCVQGLIEENRDAKCLQITLHVDVDGNYFDLNHEWGRKYPEFTILEVNIPPRIRGEELVFEKTLIDSHVIEEYFEKTGMGDRADLKNTCLGLFDKYGK